MKKNIIFLLFLFVLFICFGCNYNNKYNGKYKELYTVAINSLLWNNGHSFTADRYCDSEINIVEEDEFGRILFTYYEKYYAGGYISFSALLICQKIADKQVYYYENINFIIKDDSEFHQLNNEFDDESIYDLKIFNDWNMKIDLSRCISKEVTDEKMKIPFGDDIKNDIINIYALDEKWYLIYTDFLTYNFDSSMFIFYGYVRCEEENIYFIGVCEIELNIINNITINTIPNPYDYKDELMSLKENVKWS